MLYKLSASIDRLEPQKSTDFAQAGALEKDLENPLAGHLLETLYEDDPLLPFFQERRRQEEPDICALDRYGNLVVFELKRAGAGRGALEQLLRYVESASSWDYAALNRKFGQYRRGEAVQLRSAHRQATSIRALQFYGDGTLARIPIAMRLDLTRWAQAVDLVRLPGLRSQRGLSPGGPER